MNMENQPAGGAEAASDPHRRGRYGRVTSYAGILLLCVSFWLPQVEGCNEDIIPAHETAESGGAFLFLLALPFLVGFVLAVAYFLRMLLRRARAKAALDGVTCVFCVLALLWGAVMLGCVLLDGDILNRASSLDLDDLVFLGMTAVVWLSVAAALAVAVIRRLGGARRPICVGCAAVASLFYFLSFVWGARYGLLVSVTACTLITGVSAWEAVRILRGARPPTQAWA